MSASLQPEPKAVPALTPAPKPSLTPVQGGLLQRKCACGGSQGVAGDCKECGKKRLTLQRYSTDRATPSNLLRSLGEVSDPGSRTIVEAGSGHDFSRVQVHTRAPRGIQTKPAVSQPGDQYEQEADRIAERVMRASVPTISERDQAIPSPVAAPPTEQMPGDDAAISAQSDRAEETQTPGAPPAEAAPETAAPEETAAAGMIVEDEAQEVGPGQMRKNEFLDELQSAVCTTADAELAAVGRTAQGCPYIEQWIAYYRTRDSQYIERAIRRYAPETVGIASAREYIPVLAERVRRAVAVWATTGQITGVPEGVSAEAPGAGAPVGGGSPPSAAGNILFKGREGGARDADPQAIQAQLGSGRSLDGGVRSRMESAFGHDFSRVRVHTDAGAASLAANLNARAFTIGSDIAFGAGEYQPGTLVGDALMAHELAHVVQQGGSVSSAAPMPKGGAEYNSLEEDADNSAVGAVVSLWGGAKGALANIAQNAMPRLKSGLRLQRCSKKKETCSEGDKAISVDLVKLRGSSRTPATDLTEANKVYKKCCVQFTKVKDETVPNDPPKKLSDTWLGGDTDLKWDPQCGLETEEKTMWDGAAAEYHLSSRMRVFYVASITPATGLAYSRPPFCATGVAAPYVNHAVISNTALTDTLAHEFGHILLNSGDHKGIDNPSDKNNVMFAPGRTGSDLDASQCTKIYNNA